MKFVLFNVDIVDDAKLEEIGTADYREFSDEVCIALAEEDGFIFNSAEEFERAFNEISISTDVHQLRIIK